MTSSVYNLSSFNKFNNDIEQRWKTFLDRRQTRLVQELRYSTASEKVAEDILQDFFTIALDWQIININNQIKFADIVLTHQGLKRLIIEVKRPNSLSWNKTSIEKALEQAYGYAQQQRVTSIAVSDGSIFYAADIKNGGLEDRVKLHLDNENAPPNLFWISVNGILRPVEQLQSDDNLVLDKDALSKPITTYNANKDPVIFHPKHKTPARCFAYVADPLKPATWRLPYRNIDGNVDNAHLPGAIRALVSNYRGAHNKTVPEEAVPDVLVRLGRAAWEAKKMPGQITKPLESYKQLYDALYQLDRLDEIKHS